MAPTLCVGAPTMDAPRPAAGAAPACMPTPSVGTINFPQVALRGLARAVGSATSGSSGQ
ncbi:hypothetical protein D3C78_1645170 [compost metagenome]